MTDVELAEALKTLGMDATSFRALALLPVVHVAWADGRVQDAERELILRLAEERYHLAEEGLRVLRNWLHHEPTTGYVRRGHKVLLGLSKVEGFGRDALTDVVGFSQEVARAAGGVFGFGAVSAEEAEAIAAIAQALDIEHDRPWVDPDDATMIPADADTEGEGPPPEVLFHIAAIAHARSRGTLVRYDELSGDQTCPVTAEGVVIGRNRDCTVQITYDGQVSRRHCRVFEREGRFYVEDLGSARGTWVNGERVVERRLLGGETIHLGHATFFFQLSPEDPPSLAPHGR